MANIDGLIGFNSSTGTSVLFAAYGNDIVNVSTGLGYSANITAGNKGEFANFLDNSFYQNGNDGLRRFTGLNWRNETVYRNGPIAKYAHLSPRNRLMFGYVTYNGLTFASRVWYTDLPENNDVTYGLDYANDLSQTAASKIVISINARFQTRNIKVGDPFVITSGNNAGQYTVASIDSERQITLVETLNTTATNSSFWVGGNFFEVQTNDSDTITGLGDNSDRDLIFKLMSVFRYDGNSLRKLKDAVGTSSHRSIINYKGYTYYFHGSEPALSGIYRTDGITSEKVSKPIDPYIQGMSSTNYPEVVAWREGDELRFFIGDLTNTSEDISLTKAVATYNTLTEDWDVGPIVDTVKVATTFRTANQQDWYLGTDDAQVLKANSGNSFNSSPITLIAETKPLYPAGPEVLNEIPYVQIVGKNTRGIKVKYKLWNQPKEVDSEWWSLGELDADKTEFALSNNHFQGSGIAIRFEEMGLLENDYFIERITIFYKVLTTKFKYEL